MADLDLPSRREIYQAIEDAPGVHARALLDRLDYAKGTLQYHLDWLVDAGLIEVVDDGKYTRYYRAGEFDERDRAVMNALRRTYARRVIAHLAADGPLTTGELADRLEKADSTISWHLSRLAEVGLVEKERRGRTVDYRLADPERARLLYTRYRGSFTDRLVDNLLDLWETY